MPKFAAGLNLTGHPLIIFQAITFLHNHPELPIQARKNTLFDIFSELHGLYGRDKDQKYKKELDEMGVLFDEFQSACYNLIDGDEYSSPLINQQRNSLDKIQLRLKDFIVELQILKEARMGIVSEPTW